MIVETKHWFPTDVIILDGPSVIPIAPASFPFWMAPASMALVKVHGTNVFSHGTNVFSAPTSSPSTYVFFYVFWPLSLELLTLLFAQYFGWPQRPLAPASFGPSVKLSFQRPCL